ncbi:MAG: hypothetical protein K2W85_01890 [Phycisphaerales bacterium]|nr:hypothetical protein [Phycisphaerales bacterium]
MIEARDKLSSLYLSEEWTAGATADTPEMSDVHGVGIGRGEERGELAIVLLTRPTLRSRDADQIRSRAEKESKQQVVVRPTAEFVAQPASSAEADASAAMSTARNPTGPVMLGDSCGHANLGGSGTLGTLAWMDDGTLVVLSNQHVFCDSKLNANVGDPILSPGPGDGGTSTRSVIASFERHGSLSFKSKVVNEVDAACASIDVHALGNDVRSLGPVRGTIEKAWTDLLVAKHGRTTGHTEGRVAVDSTTARIRYPKGVIELTNIFLVESTISDQPFGARGDSGSVIPSRQQPTAGRNLPSGLLFAVNDRGDAFACQMDRVCASLKVTL